MIKVPKIIINKEDNSLINENSALREQIKEREREFKERTAAITEKISEADREYEKLKIVHQTQIEAITKKRSEIVQQIALLKQNQNTLLNDELFQENRELRSDIDLMKQQIEESERSVLILSEAVEKTKHEITELTELMDEIPCDNSEVIAITRRMIDQKIQSQIFEWKLKEMNHDKCLSDLKEEVNLIRVVAKGLENENGQLRDRQKQLEKSLTELENERDSLKESLKKTDNQIPLTTLNMKIRENEAKVVKEVKEMELCYTKEMERLERELEKTTEDYNNACQSIEAINIKIQELTAEAIQVIDAGKRDLARVEKRNHDEIDDIQERFKSQKETALLEQRERILRTMPE